MTVSPEIYDRDYFLSHLCEGYEDFISGRLSLVRKYEIDVLRLRPGLRLLDAGCGRGEMLRACHEAGVEVAGIDFSEAAIALTRQTLAGIDGADVRRGDVTALPWPGRSFDRVLCGDVIEHIAPGDAERALSEFHRVLRPGGMLLVHTAPNRLFRNVSWPVLRLFLRLAGAGEFARMVDENLADPIGYHPNEQSRASLRRLLKRSGFADVRAWIDPDVIRSGSHQLTQGMDRSLLVKIGTHIAALWPLLELLGNDIYATGSKED